MTLDEFEIGEDFFISTKDGNVDWRCTDKGTRTITAVCLADHPDDLSWFNGPPYAVLEHVMDEDTMIVCYLPKPKLCQHEWELPFRYVYGPIPMDTEPVIEGKPHEFPPSVPRRKEPTKAVDGQMRCGKCLAWKHPNEPA